MKAKNRPVTTQEEELERRLAMLEARVGILEAMTEQGERAL